jgi:hypothetical protein
VDQVTAEPGDEFCRAIETYLCRKNDGHLIRIVGPSFDCVRGWATQGVPLSIACLGIDRYFERYYAKGRRRRPVRVEFCDADVMDAFDQWRQALGVPAAHPAAPSGDTVSRRPHSLGAHIERTIARLSVLRSSRSPDLAILAEPVIAELDTLQRTAAGLRGEAREAVLAKLCAIDAALTAGARELCDSAALASLARAADEELAPFRTRMPPPVYDEAHTRAVDRLVRQRFELPTIAFDA